MDIYALLAPAQECRAHRWGRWGIFHGANMRLATLRHGSTTKLSQQNKSLC